MRSRASARSGASIRETGKHNFVIVQAEDELAAIGAVIGAMWNGARAFTPTSGPGISLMNEFIGLAYYAEVPAVIFDIQRVGPSTGMPTRTQQCDLMLAAYASHGDTRHVLLFPNSPEECFYMAVQAFDLAERLQTPVFVMSDLDIGMNDWMCPALKWDDSVPPGSRQGADEGADREARQVPSLPRQGRRRDSVSHAAGRASERRVLHARLRTHAVRRLHRGLDRVPDRARPSEAEVRHGEDSWCRRRCSTARAAHDVGIVSLGSCDGAVREALDILKRRGIQLDYMRVRSFPFGQEVEEFLASHSTAVRRRAEPRRAAAQPADARNRRREGEAALDPALQRPADVVERASSTASLAELGDAKAVASAA